MIVGNYPIWHKYLSIIAYIGLINCFVWNFGIALGSLIILALFLPKW